MSYKVEPTSTFDREVKKLAKKYPSIREDVSALVGELKEDPTKGISLGNNCYKIRLAIKSKGKGKSGGGRVMTHVRVLKESVHLLAIFDKSDRDNISTVEIDALLKNLNNNKIL